MTLSNEKVKAFLDANFVRGWINIEGKTPYAGKSNTHLPGYPAKSVYNCSGHHNVQMFFLTSDGRVVHSLPGYWAPQYFMEEARLAVQLAKLYYAKNLSIDERSATTAAYRDSTTATSRSASRAISNARGASSRAP